MSQPFLALSDAVATVAAYTTAVQLGVLDRIDREPAGPEELARTCGANERGVRVLLGALESGGFVERLGDGRYRPTLTGLAGYHPLLPMWEHLPDAVRSGVPLGDRSPALALLCGFWAESAERVAGVLPVADRVLDAAAGAGTWSIAYARRVPGARVTAVEAAATLPLARRAVVRAGLADRFDCRVGDVFEVALEVGGYDLILLPHVCNLFDEVACGRLFGRLAPALAPGGTLAVIEALPGGSGAALRELSLYLRTPGGSVHPVECYQRWLGEAGLRSVVAVNADADTAVITAVR